MSTSLDNQATDLLNEILEILIPNWNKHGTSSVIVYMTLEGPMAYTYEVEGEIKKGVFKGDYTNRTLKTLVNILEKDVNSSVIISPKTLYSYRLSTNVWYG